jgi:hypothetical protein
MNATPLSDAVQNVITTARAHVAARLADSSADETLNALAAALDALDEEETAPEAEAPEAE